MTYLTSGTKVTDGVSSSILGGGGALRWRSPTTGEVVDIDGGKGGKGGKAGKGGKGGKGGKSEKDAKSGKGRKGEKGDEGGKKIGEKKKRGFVDGLTTPRGFGFAFAHR